MRKALQKFTFAKITQVWNPFNITCHDSDGEVIDLASNKDEEGYSELGSILTQAQEEEARHLLRLGQMIDKATKQTSLREWVGRTQRAPPEVAFILPVRTGKYPSIDEMPTDMRLEEFTFLTEWENVTHLKEYFS